MYHYFCHARVSCNENLLDSLSLSISVVCFGCVFSPCFKVFKGIYDESCKAVVWERKKFLCACTAGCELWSTIDKRNLSWALPGSFIFPFVKTFFFLLFVHAKGKKKLSSVNRERSQIVLNDLDSLFSFHFLLHKNNIISYFYCYFYSSHLHTFFSLLFSAVYFSFLLFFFFIRFKTGFSAGWMALFFSFHSCMYVKAWRKE